MLTILFIIVHSFLSKSKVSLHKHVINYDMPHWNHLFR